MKKSIYKITNWKAYNEALIKRGQITLWFDQNIVDSWFNNNQTGKKGRSNTYSDLVIECALTIRTLYRLPLRSTQGFMMSFACLLGKDLPVPNYTTLSRRTSKLNIDLSRIRTTDEPLHILIDSTGLKVYGEGEWKIRTHGKSKRRTWRKLHVAINRETHQIEAISLTKSNIHDSFETKHLLDQIDKVRTVTADKAYDNHHAHKPIIQKEALSIIPVRSGACLNLKDDFYHVKERNRLIREKHYWGGSKMWKIASNYHKRSLVETAMFRIKTLIGEKLQSKLIENQKTETIIMAKLINKMTSFGMPKTIKI